MPDKKKEPEIVALEEVYSALKPLSPELRVKVLTSLYALLDISPIDFEGKPVVEQPKEQPMGSRPTNAPMLPIESSRPLGLVELVREKNPGSNAQRIALFAYYRDRHEGIPRFGRDDLKPFRKSRRSLSKTFNVF